MKSKKGMVKLRNRIVWCFIIVVFVVRARNCNRAVAADVHERAVFHDVGYSVLYRWRLIYFVPAE